MSGTSAKSKQTLKRRPAPSHPGCHRICDQLLMQGIAHAAHLAFRFKQQAEHPCQEGEGAELESAMRADHHHTPVTIQPAGDLRRRRRSPGCGGGRRAGRERLTGWRWAWAEPPSGGEVQTYYAGSYRNRAGCLGWIKFFKILMPHRPCGAWGLTAKPCWKPGFSPVCRQRCWPDCSVFVL